jgi:hypothetical protein
MPQEDEQTRTDYSVGDLNIFFTPELRAELSDPKYLAIRGKFLNSLRYGYIGFSRGGRNGIVAITERDHKLFEDFERFKATERYNEIIQLEDLVDPIGVKVVAHIPSGKRMVGLYSPTTNKAVFYAIGRY